MFCSIIFSFNDFNAGESLINNGTNGIKEYLWKAVWEKKMPASFNIASDSLFKTFPNNWNFFTGNVVLKLAESIYDITQRRNIKDEHFDRFNFESHGGVPVLGVSKPVIIGHGISHATAFKNMINIACRMMETDLSGKIKNSFAELTKQTRNPQP